MILSESTCTVICTVGSSVVECRHLLRLCVHPLSDAIKFLKMNSHKYKSGFYQAFHLPSGIFTEEESMKDPGKP